MKKFEVSDFNDTEIGELRLYIEKHVPYHILNKMYLLSDNIEDKMVIFTGVYRILSSCKNYASTKELKNKLDYFLQKAKPIYKKSSPLITEYTILQINYGKNSLLREMGKIICDNFEIMDELIDVFIVLGEHIQLMKTDAVIGVTIRHKDDEIKKLINQSRIIAQKEGA